MFLLLLYSNKANINIDYVLIRTLTVKYYYIIKTSTLINVFSY